jgi:hypothetical protein
MSSRRPIPALWSRSPAHRFGASLWGDGAYRTLLETPQGSGGYAICDGKVGMFRSVRVDPPGPMRVATVIGQDDAAQTFALHELKPFWIEIYGRPWRGAFVRSELCGRPAPGFANIWRRSDHPCGDNIPDRQRSLANPPGVRHADPIAHGMMSQVRAEQAERGRIPMREDLSQFPGGANLRGISDPQSRLTRKRGAQGRHEFF